MASNLVLTAQEGAGSSLTMFAHEDDAVTAGVRVVWTTIAAKRDSPWEEVRYTGFAGIDAKLHGVKPIRYMVSGFIFSETNSEAQIIVARDLVLALNAALERYVAAGPLVATSADGLIVGPIVFAPMGESIVKPTFTVELIDLSA